MYGVRLTTQARPAHTHVHIHSPILIPSEAPEPTNVFEVEVEVGKVPEEMLVAVAGEYGTVDDPATRYVPLVGVGICATTEAADEERL